MNVLLFVQEPTEKAILSTGLQLHNLTVHACEDVTTALSSNSGEPASLIIASLPDASPLTIVRQVRDVTAVPLIMIVEPLSEKQQRALLTAGATLVLARPYSTCILITQSLALLRDMGGGLSPELSCLSEYQLLHTLMRHQNQTLPVDMLIEHLYGCPSKGSRKMVCKIVSRLRAKIEPDRRNPRYVITVRSVGYAFHDS